MKADTFAVLQATKFMRLMSEDLEFERVRTKSEPQRIRRGSYWFRVTLKYLDADDELVETDYRLCFQPDNPAYFIDRIWVGTEDDLKEALSQGEGITSVFFINSESLKVIRVKCAEALTKLEHWILSQRGIPGFGDGYFGRYFLYAV